MNNKAVLQYEWSLVLWTYEFQGAKYTVSVKTELRFFGCLEAKVRSQEPSCFARAQPWWIWKLQMVLFR